MHLRMKGLTESIFFFRDLVGLLEIPNWREFLSQELRREPSNDLCFLVVWPMKKWRRRLL